MFQKFLRVFGVDPHKKEISKFLPLIERINQFEPEYGQLSEEALRGKTAEFRRRLAEGETLEDLMPEAFAAVREASKRTIGLRHYDVQLIGGFTLNEGKIAEMRTGEGKTLVATLPLYLNALAGRGAHLVTVNDYLARRDARWMAPIYNYLGMSVGVLQMAARTENGRNAFLVDLERTSPHEDQHQLRMVLRREAYHADITYGTNSEFGFDYLRDNLTMSLDERSQRGHFYGIVDEVDNVLIDEARTPLIISGPASEETEWYVRTSQVVRQLRPEDYEISEKDRTVTLTELGEAHVEELLDLPLRDPERPEDITPEQARILGYLEQALRAQFLYRRNKDYLVQSGKVIIVDEFTGRLMPGRRWSEGLHQAVEAKEGVRIEPENVTYATITLQNYYRMYEKLAGMTGTALTESEEFYKIYKLDVLPIPTNLEYQASLSETELISKETKDDQGYKFTYYAYRDREDEPVFWKRKDFPDVVYRTEEGKLRAISREILYNYIIGRPQLVGTTSVEHSEILSDRLGAESMRRFLQIIMLRRSWMEKNHIEMIERQIPELQPLDQPLGQLNPGDLRPLARSLGVSLNLEEPENSRRLRDELGLSDQDLPRLLNVVQAGIPHKVLNARKHDEESQIIASAGAFGAVTIATNMAGRGVDIKLGGELPEEILRDTNRVLGRVEMDPYDMTFEERRDALLKISPEEYGIYEESVNTFLQFMKDQEQVRVLGGLHVIGSERHESRRIDNQLRGRAARQGDPGSSRFYLSLEDDLMRLFGGQQVENLWKRIFFDESLPLEMGLLGRLVEQSQERVEGANFDVRKHLLEYDDVLNGQRKRIYEQRDRVFTKANLTEDVLDMLRVELQQRIPVALKDEEGPWKLLAFLDEVQPSIEFQSISFPPFSYRLLIDSVLEQLPKQGANAVDLRKALLSLAVRALKSEREHLMRSIRDLFDRTQETVRNQINERFDLLDTFEEGLGETEEGMPDRRPQDLLSEISELVRIPLKLNSDQLRGLPEGDEDVIAELRSQIDDALTGISVSRLVGTLERRLEESLNIQVRDLLNDDWKGITDHLYDAVEGVFDQREDRLFGEKGQVGRDLDNLLERMDDIQLSDRQMIQFLMAMAQGTRLTFDSRTHRRGQRSYMRLSYVYLAANLMEEDEPDVVTKRVLAHLEDGLQALQDARGMNEWNYLEIAQATLNQLDSRVQEQLVEALGEEQYRKVSTLALSDIDAESRELIQDALGARMQNEAYRQLLLRVISDQWVEYLTKVEALRVSIGLEAYAQRDPLVQYKGRATELFRELLADIRMGVISRLFTFQVQRSASAAFGREQATVADEEKAGAVMVDQGAGESAERQPSKKKRRRH